ncbi:hypothetical protein EV11_1665 [Prochlorococcus sp. SS52]|uniref:Uncharacterized protein n=1 Tax=Prochlorococcus marinus (strain SARG / CCMP1375 / SS120) TaxID=167539 RepID=Q7VCH1_PROMA|nr:Predicted protein [Prochlorococcus marinus subsp. marinus str. CCMP1375]KGG35262.1 hypothetical protein EV11_1665 [Prochlorococcus sp. SS52]
MLPEKSLFWSKPRQFIRSFGVPIGLVLLSLWDLRVDLRLLFENFTFIALAFAVYKHPLAIFTLLIVPRFLSRRI